MRLSVLDQSPVGEGSSHADALLASVDLAQAAEEWGFARYWTAEHHASPGFAGSAPEILAAVLLARTSRMPVGTGGVLLPRYPPVKVAEVFAVLASLYPGRVDMGLGRAGGPAADYPQRVSLLRRLLGMDGSAKDGTAEDEAHRLVGAPVAPPRMWLLGAGSGSARMAGELGTDFAYAHFLAPDRAEEALTTYRALLRGRNTTDEAPGVLAVRVVTAESEAEAEALAHSVLLWRSRKDLGEDLPLPSARVARNHRWTALEAERASVRRRSLVWGTPDQVLTRLAELAKEYAVEEVMVNTLTCDPEDRFHSYRLLAEWQAVTVGG
ncbi:MsnO8 family LLM class oxidoreductase [Streptomyces cyaneofuscatus]|uniref:MsnO8 family LLM class oxidoreductase n=1 Tax=Streptomyces cyaneofuscatus TaxID=66883 RepID=UPI0038663AB7|nr:MsnO8 family LLM class oxidoreductase [Streptomyces cyaneofuscatus]